MTFYASVRLKLSPIVGLKAVTEKLSRSPKQSVNIKVQEPVVWTWYSSLRITQPDGATSAFESVIVHSILRVKTGILVHLQYVKKLKPKFLALFQLLQPVQKLNPIFLLPSGGALAAPLSSRPLP